MAWNAHMTSDKVMGNKHFLWAPYSWRSDLQPFLANVTTAPADIIASHFPAVGRYS